MNTNVNMCIQLSVSRVNGVWYLLELLFTSQIPLSRYSIPNIRFAGRNRWFYTEFKKAAGLGGRPQDWARPQDFVFFGPTILGPKDPWATTRRLDPLGATTRRLDPFCCCRRSSLSTRHPFPKQETSQSYGRWPYDWLVLLFYWWPIDILYVLSVQLEQSYRPLGPYDWNNQEVQSLTFSILWSSWSS